MTTVSLCPRCGTAILVGNNFCSECGTDVTGPLSTAATTRMTPVATKIMPASVEESMLDVLRHATLGDFEVLKELGRGGMAMVYLAHDLALNRKVAIKVMLPSISGDESMAERFVREAQTAASLSHPNIIPVYSVKHHEDVTFFVMKFIPGRPLDDFMRELGPMPIDMVTAILQQVAGALGYGHKRGVVHRDVKPGNVMIDDEGWAIVADFGIAKVDTAEGLTQTGAAIGTPAYMSPEQCTAKDVTGASDQYSLGIVAYEMITGSKPFEGDSVMAVMYGHVHEELADIRSKRSDCPEPLAQAVSRMLAKKPEDRFEHMEDLITTLGAAPLSHDDPVRSQMMTLAAEGISAKLLKQIVTPRSPIPKARERTPKPVAPGQPGPGVEPMAADRTGVAHRTRTLVGAPRKRESEKRLYAVLGGMAIVGSVALLILAPWDSAPVVTEPTLPVPVENAPTTPAAPTQQPIARIDIGPDEPVLDVDQTLLLSATALGFDDLVISGVPITWISEDEAVASVSPLGEVTGRAAGTVRLVASAGDVRSAVTLTIQTPPPPAPVTVRVASVALNRQQLSLSPDETAQLRATPRSSDGSAIGGRTVAWRSSDPSIATVSRSGQVHAVGSGRATISATVENQRADAAVTVGVEPVASVSVNPSSGTLEPGQTLSVSARLMGSAGTALIDRTVVWESGSVSIATVSPDGIVTAVSPGVTTISAVADGRRGSASITVNTPEPVGLTDSESRAQIQTLVDNWGTALESRDINRLRQANPGMTGEEETRWTQFFDLVRSLDAQLDISNVAITGNDATANVQAQYVYTLRAGQETQNTPLIANFVLLGQQWRMRSIR